MCSRVRSGAESGAAAIRSIAAGNPPMLTPMKTMAAAPNVRNSTVWKVLTHAVPRIPPKKT